MYEQKIKELDKQIAVLEKTKERYEFWEFQQRCASTEAENCDNEEPWSGDFVTRAVFLLILIAAGTIAFFIQ